MHIEIVMLAIAECKWYSQLSVCVYMSTDSVYDPLFVLLSLIFILCIFSRWFIYTISLSL